MMSWAPAAGQRESSRGEKEHRRLPLTLTLQEGNEMIAQCGINQTLMVKAWGAPCTPVVSTEPWGPRWGFGS